MWFGILGLAVCYYAAGQLSLLMAIPPGYATAFWPAAGLSVAALLLFGNRLWPGVFLGAFLVRIGTQLDLGTLSGFALSTGLPMVIAAGATLQALLGAFLVRRFVGFPNRLNRERDVAALLVLAGPISCLAGATLGVSCLWLLSDVIEQVPVDDVAFSWWLWWVGETIGVFVVAPVMLLWAERPRPDWPRRPITVSVPLAVMAGLVMALYVHSDVREKDRLRSEFRFQTEIMARGLENRIDSILQGLNRVRSLHGSQHNPVEKDKFAKAARVFLNTRPGVQALAWTPRILAADRAEFEKTFPITQLDKRETVPAQERGEYFPILYREPASPKAQGFDVAFDSDRLEALQRAGRSGEPIASTPIPHLDEADKKSIFVFLPIYRDNVIPAESPEQRLSAVLGYVIAFVRVDHLFDVAMSGIVSSGIDIWLFDDTAPIEKRFVYFRGSGRRSTADELVSDVAKSKVQVRTTVVETAGRRWRLQFAQTPEYLMAHHSLEAWVVLAGGMLCTGLLGAVLMAATGRAELVAGLVEERTSELAQANTAMKQEIAERIRVEEALRTREESLRQSEERFRLLVEGTTDYAIFMLDPGGHLVSWNAGAERTLGYHTDEILGQHFARFFTAEDIGHGKPATELEVAARLGRCEEEGWRVRHDGSRFWVHAVLTPFRHADGQLRGYWEIIRDLTERKQTEEKFRGLLESAPDAVVIVKEDGTIALVNRQTEHVFGFTRAELLGRSIDILIPPRFRTQYDGYRETYFANPSAQPMGAALSLDAVRKDGTEFPAEISLSPLETAEGTLVSSAIRDVTQRKRAEAALEETRRFVQRIAEMTPSILYVYDVKQQCNIFVNRRLESFLGYAREGNQSPSMPTLLNDVHPDDLPRAEWAFEQCQSADDGAVIETDYRVRHANGEWRWLNCRNTIFVRDSEGNPVQILGAAQDITENKRLEEEVLNIAASEQRRIGQELHDGTGQELTGLCMLSDNLADKLTAISLSEAQTARRIAQGLRQALGQVRLLSRGLIPVEVDAEGLMAALTELTNRISDLHGIHCVFECAAPVPVEDNYTATQLFRIAQEAITNALKHGQAGNLLVSLEARGHYITLKITDDGVGMPDDDAVQEGMGLRIMRYRASQIGANLTVHPAQPHGTVVTCTLVRGSIHE